MIKPEDVTIIIPHLGGTPESEFALNQCWLSLEETVPQIKKLLITNGKAKYGEPIGDIKLFEQGQCKAVNAAVATTNTPWILVTNDDMIYFPEWFERLTERIDDEKCISPKLIEPRPGAPTFEVQSFGGAGGDFNKQAWLDFAKEYRGNDWRTGFNLPFLMTRELWDTVGGYDINYDPWGSNSDSDLEYKIKLAGIQPYQNTNSIVYHFSQTSGTFEPRNNEYWQKNFAYFEEKWGFPRTDVGIWEANFDIPEPPIRKFTPEWEEKYK